MPKRQRHLIILLVMLTAAAVVGVLWRSPTPTPAVLPPHSYDKALQQAREGEPGAARVLYQQLQRTDLTPTRRAALYAELPNYPSPLALKLAREDLQHAEPQVRRAVIASIPGLLPPAQRSLVLGPLLDDNDQSVRFAAVDALIGLEPDAIGLYFRPLQEALEQYEMLLEEAPDDVDSRLHLARLYLHEQDYARAATALQRVTALDPDNLQALILHARSLEQQGQHDASRDRLAKALELRPDSALLQYQLGQWLLRHEQQEYALLAFSRAVELAPDDSDYRYTLAQTLHGLDQPGPAQQQLQALLDRQPANRRARILLIQYWMDAGQLQNVQILQAELERLNADDPALQQGL